MGAVAHYVEVNAPVQSCCDWWRKFTKLPRILSDVERVGPIDGSGTRTRWIVSGPAGKSISWDVEVVEDAPPHKIAWATVDSTDPAIKNSGVVRFDDKGNSTTGVEVSLEYEPPASKFGEAVAPLLADPQVKVERAVSEFKTIIEELR